MAQEKPIFEYHDESHTEKLSRKAKESPFMILGIASCIGAVSYGAWAYKRRGKMSTSVYLMQFRVIAQGAAVSALTVGMLFQLYHNLKPKTASNALPQPNQQIDNRSYLVFGSSKDPTLK